MATICVFIIHDLAWDPHSLEVKGLQGVLSSVGERLYYRECAGRVIRLDRLQSGIGLRSLSEFDCFQPVEKDNRTTSPIV